MCMLRNLTGKVFWPEISAQCQKEMKDKGRWPEKAGDPIPLSAKGKDAGKIEKKVAARRGTLLKKSGWDADSDEFEAAFPGFRRDWDAKKAAPKQQKQPWQDIYTACQKEMKDKGRWPEKAGDPIKLSQKGKDGGEIEKKVAIRRYKLLTKSGWGAECDEFEAAFPGFRRDWDAKKATN